jgi:hypothetical protein
LAGQTIHPRLRAGLAAPHAVIDLPAGLEPAHRIAVIPATTRRVRHPPPNANHKPNNAFRHRHGHARRCPEVVRGMKFGVAAFITDEGIGPQRLGAAVEERGFHSLVVPEHSHIPVAYEEPYPGAGELPRDYHRTLDPFVALSSRRRSRVSLS